MIRILRIVVPVFSVGVIVLGVLQPFLAERLGSFSLSGLDIQSGRITMNDPELFGEDKNNRSFKITADKATQDTKTTHLVDLEMLRAEIEMQSGGALSLVANHGAFNKQAETLQLRDNIVLTSTLGHQGMLKSAFVSFPDGRIVSEERVELSTPANATLTAAGVIISDNGTQIVFKGPVRLVIPERPRGR